MFVLRISTPTLAGFTYFFGDFTSYLRIVSETRLTKISCESFQTYYRQNSSHETYQTVLPCPFQGVLR